MMVYVLKKYVTWCEDDHQMMIMVSCKIIELQFFMMRGCYKKVY